MPEPEIFDHEIRALQEWLRAAWRQLADPSLTAFDRRELRNQMKHCSADLRAQLQRVMEWRSSDSSASKHTSVKPELRIPV
jgi:hypothetical protein